jgi:hypothetical protein
VAHLISDVQFLNLLKKPKTTEKPRETIDIIVGKKAKTKEKYKSRSKSQIYNIKNKISP